MEVFSTMQHAHKYWWFLKRCILLGGLVEAAGTSEAQEWEYLGLTDPGLADIADRLQARDFVETKKFILLR